MRQWLREAGDLSSRCHRGHSPISRNRPKGTRQSHFDLQNGDQLGMPLSRPIPSVANGVSELRMRDRDGIYRAFYYTQSPRGILVLHAFAKRTQATPKREFDLGKKRLKELLDEKV
jgi:phage-related protein